MGVTHARTHAQAARAWYHGARYLSTCALFFLSLHHLDRGVHPRELPIANAVS